METPFEETAEGVETSEVDVLDSEPHGPEVEPDGSDASPLEGLEAAIAGLDARLEEAQRLHARQSDLVDRLHSENQQLRKGELREAKLPLVRDLLRLHDDVERILDADASDDLRIVQQALVDLLARNGVERFAPDRGDAFDSGVHAAVGVEPTADESLDRSVAGVVKQGFRWGPDDVIRVAEVRAYSYRPEPADES